MLLDAKKELPICSQKTSQLAGAIRSVLQVMPKNSRELLLWFTKEGRSEVDVTEKVNNVLRLSPPPLSPTEARDVLLQSIEIFRDLVRDATTPGKG